MKKSLLSLILLILCMTYATAQLYKKDPLIVVDGKISNNDILKTMDINEIESLSVIKYPRDNDKEDYGILADNGIIFIRTKNPVPADSLSEQSTKPLVLVDGVPYCGNLDSIDVQTIESVSVLKGIDATRNYGKAGENGVVQVKTKSESASR